MDQEPLTYSEIGATADVGTTGGVLPVGYHHVRESAVVGTTRADFEAAAATVMTWGMHRGAGLTVKAAGDAARTGEDVTFGFGPISVPVRVVYVVDEPNRAGFAYGTRRGHPECGEESFIVHFDEIGHQVRLEITAFSKPGTWWVRVGAPIGRLVQAWVTRRYIRAVVVKDFAR